MQQNISRSLGGGLRLGGTALIVIGLLLVLVSQYNAYQTRIGVVLAVLGIGLRIEAAITRSRSQ